jgi:hypothetical protein
MFTTKAYTISSLINEVSSLTPSQVSTVTKLANAISPRAGLMSAKVHALNTYLNGQLSSVVSGSGSFKSFGKTPRTRVVNALRARKNTSTNSRNS